MMLIMILSIACLATSISADHEAYEYKIETVQDLNNTVQELVPMPISELLNSEDPVTLQVSISNFGMDTSFKFESASTDEDCGGKPALNMADFGLYCFAGYTLTTFFGGPKLTVHFYKPYGSVHLNYETHLFTQPQADADRKHAEDHAVFLDVFTRAEIDNARSSEHLLTTNLEWFEKMLSKQAFFVQRSRFLSDSAQIANIFLGPPVVMESGIMDSLVDLSVDLYDAEYINPSTESGSDSEVVSISSLPL